MRLRKTIMKILNKLFKQFIIVISIFILLVIVFFAIKMGQERLENCQKKHSLSYCLMTQKNYILWDAINE